MILNSWFLIFETHYVILDPWFFGRKVIPFHSHLTNSYLDCRLSIIDSWFWIFDTRCLILGDSRLYILILDWFLMPWVWILHSGFLNLDIWFLIYLILMLDILDYWFFITDSSLLILVFLFWIFRYGSYILEL